MSNDPSLLHYLNHIRRNDPDFLEEAKEYIFGLHLECIGHDPSMLAPAFPFNVDIADAAPGAPAVMLRDWLTSVFGTQITGDYAVWFDPKTGAPRASFECQTDATLFALTFSGKLMEVTDVNA